MAYFISQKHLKFAQQVSMFGSQLPDYAALLGFNATEESNAADDGAYMDWAVTIDHIVERYAAECKQFMHTIRKGDPDNPLLKRIAAPTPPVLPPEPTVVDLNIQARYAKNAKKAKSSKNYASSIGQKLGIEAAKKVFNPNEGKPKVRVTMDGGFPLIKFTKGQYKAANLYKDSGSGFGTKPFKTLLYNTFHDTTPLPAADTAQIVRYKMVYLHKDMEVGEESDMVSVTVSG